MSKKQSPFFATHDDLVSLAREVMEVRPFDLVHGGLFEEPRLQVISDVANLMSFEAFLVVDRGMPVNFRLVPQRSGGEMYAVDQLNNPYTIWLDVGGLLAERHLIAGRIGTVGNCHQSDELYAVFTKVIRRRFEKIKSFHVGPEAAFMLDNGGRLSATPKSPKIYDLIR